MEVATAHEDMGMETKEGGCCGMVARTGRGWGVNKRGAAGMQRHLISNKRNLRTVIQKKYRSLETEVPRPKQSGLFKPQTAQFRPPSRWRYNTPSEGKTHQT